MCSLLNFVEWREDASNHTSKGVGFACLLTAPSLVCVLFDQEGYVVCHWPLSYVVVVEEVTAVVVDISEMLEV